MIRNNVVLLWHKLLSIQTIQKQLHIRYDNCNFRLLPGLHMKKLIIFLIICPQLILSMEKDSSADRLWQGLQTNDPLMILHALQAGANPNKKSPIEHETPFEFAASRLSEECCRTLIEHGANPNPYNSVGDPFFFSELFTAERLEFLIKLGVDLNLRDQDGDTILHYNTDFCFDQADYVSILISLGAPLNSQNKKGNTPLIKAVKSFNTEICKKLLAAGANMYIRNQYGEHAWLLAQKNNQKIYYGGEVEKQLEIRKLLKSHDKHSGKLLSELQTVDTLNKKLTDVAARGHLHLVKLLLKLGALIDARDREFKRELMEVTYNTPLMLAAKNGHFKVCEYLVRKGAQIHAQNELLITPLHFAADNGTIDIIALLLAAGAQCNTIAQHRQATPLMAAVMNQHYEAIRLLLQAGADIHITRHGSPQYDNSALTFASWFQDEKMCRLLIDRQMQNDQGLIAGLLCIKRLGERIPYLRELYSQREKFLMPYLKEYYQTHSLKRLLAQTDHDGRTAYDSFPVEWLKPWPEHDNINKAKCN